jgi:hypothetical protein
MDSVPDAGIRGGEVGILKRSAEIRGHAPDQLFRFKPGPAGVQGH